MKDTKWQKKRKKLHATNKLDTAIHNVCSGGDVVLVALECCAQQRCDKATLFTHFHGSE